MKRSLLIFSLFSLALGAASCDITFNKKNEVPPADSNSIVLNTDKDWTKSDLTAFIGDMSALPQELQTVIAQRFPKKAGLEAATVIFAGASDVAAQAARLAQAASGGAFVVVPAGVDLSQVGAAPMVGVEPSGELSPLLSCYSGWKDGTYYVMYAEPEATQSPAGTPGMSAREWEELVRINKEMDDYVGTSLTDYDNDTAQNENYFQSRMDPFVEWIEKTYKGRSLFTASESTYDELKAEIEQSGQRITCNYPFSLNCYIDQASLSDPDYLQKSGSLSVEFRIYPLYMLSSNGDKAGDYYCVVSTVTPHNQSLWGPYAAAHGWCRNRIYGYWFSSMDVATYLTDLNGFGIPGLEYYLRPLPENKNDSRTYSNGRSVSLSGSVSGGTSAQHLYLVGQVGAGVTWNSSTNYTLETINYTLDSSTPEVKYHYWSDGVNLTDDWDDWTLINRNFPASVRSEFAAHTMWIWHLPSNQVKDYDIQRYRLNLRIKLSYATWYHWRGSAEYDSNLATHDVSLATSAWQLDAPDRTPWGFIRLRNATSNEMAHVSFYRKEGGSEPFSVLPSSYGKGEEARIALPEGEYNVTWDIIDGDIGTKLSSWIYRDVKVHQGRNDETATVRISTVDGEKVE